MVRLSPLFTAALLGLPAVTFAQDTTTEVAPPTEVEAPILEEVSDEPIADEQAALDDAPEAPAVDTDTGPKLSTEEDWYKWERLGGSTFSPDGRWIAYPVARQDGTSELRLRVIATDSTEVFDQGRSATFSNDGKWMAYSIGKSKSERNKLKDQKKPIQNQMGLFDLVRGEKIELDDVQGFAFSEDGLFLSMEHYAPKGDDNGNDLVIRDLATGVDTHFGRVTSSAWSESGAWIALTIGAPEKQGNGLRVFHAATGVLRTLDSDDSEYVKMTWREDSADLAVMRKTTYEEDEDPTYTIMAWRDVSRDGAEALVFNHLKAEDCPCELRVVDYDGLRWSDDGAALYFGLKEWKERPAKLDEEPEDTVVSEDTNAPEDAEEPDDSNDVETDHAANAEAAPQADTPDGSTPKADKEGKRESLRDTLDDAPGVEIWHAQDIRIIPLQKKSARRDERKTISAIYWLETKELVKLENEVSESTRLLEGGRRALGYDETPYEEEQRFSATLSDVYSIDASTGEQERVLERVKYTMTGHPTGRCFLYVRENQIWSYDLESKQATNLTGELDVDFVDLELSQLTDEKRYFGVGGWSEDGKSVLLYDRYDIWNFPLNGKAPARLTDGTDDKIVSRRARVAADRDDDQFVDLGVGFYVTLYGDTTKKSGYGFVKAGSDAKRLIWKDAHLGRLHQADDADVFAYVEQRFDDSPDLQVAGPNLADAKEVSSTNELADQFAWGHSELVDYESASGQALQGALFYPADYDPAKTYPMVVYIYELRSQSLHRYSSPSETNPYSPAVFTQNGYFVFQPDIVYRAQNPGLSAVDCVVPAVRKVLERGQVDPDRVGLFGHSWGAYQTAFIVTQTDLFAAGVAGAPLTNMMSMSMSIYWNSGETDAKIFHESQGRMDRPFWRDVDTYIANSPIFSIEDLNTPLLVAFGDNDGAVDWQQGIEMYNAARLAQRPYVMLVYPGENHGLAVEANQVDYHHRVREWFETHMNGAESPEWISEGLPWLDQKEALEAIGKKDKKGKK